MRQPPIATSALAMPDQTLPFDGGDDSDRLSKEIFSILESNFLFGVQHTSARAEDTGGAGSVL